MKKTMIVILMLSLIALVGCTDNTGMDVPYDDRVVPVVEEQALVTTSFIEWGENIENSREAIFSFWVTNYGNIEAKNVSVKCIVSDYEDNVIKSDTIKIGNVASTSVNYEELIMNIGNINNQENYGFCFTESCSDCELLNHRLTDFEDYVGMI